MLKSLESSGVIKADAQKSIQDHIQKLDKKIEKYEKEKKEILLGSEAVGKENWIQDVDGELGKITGAKELEATLSKLGMAGGKFDLASLFYQMSLVLGAISLVLKNEKVQKLFF